MWIAAILIGSSIYTAVTSASRDASGTIVDSGKVAASEIQVGDCLTESLAATGDTFADAQAVPCAKEHTYEAFHNEDLTGDVFPENVLDQADQICRKAFEDFVGTTLENTDLDVTSVVPTKDSWETSGDRRITCLLMKYDESKMIGSYSNTK